MNTSETPTPTKRHRRQLPHIIEQTLTMLDFYGYGLLPVVLGWLLLGEAGSVFNLIPNLMPGVFLLAPVLFIIGLILRRWKMLLPNLALVIIFLALYGAMLLPRPAMPAAEGQTITFLTYNIHGEMNQLDPMVSIIRESGADVVTVQELSSAAEAYLRVKLADLYPYAVTSADRDYTMGRGTFSKYPIKEDEIVYDRRRKVFLRTLLDIDGRDVVVYNVHQNVPEWGILLNFRSSFRNSNRTLVMEHAAQETAPLVILGDFNMTDQTADYYAYAATYHDTYKEVGDSLGVSFPDYGPRHSPLSVIQPFLRLDYVFHNDAWVSQTAHVWANSGVSDHRPLYVQLVLKPS